MNSNNVMYNVLYIEKFKLRVYNVKEYIVGSEETNN